jgi:hypothetical protein
MDKEQEKILKERTDKALFIYEEWNKVTGFIHAGTSYDWEIRSIIEDAVQVGYLGQTLESLQENK